MGMWKVLYSTVLLFLPAETILMILAAGLAKRLNRILKQDRLVYDILLSPLQNETEAPGASASLLLSLIF